MTKKINVFTVVKREKIENIDNFTNDIESEKTNIEQKNSDNYFS